MLDPPGPPRAQVLRRLYGLQSPKAFTETQQNNFENSKKTLNSTEDTLSHAQTNKNHTDEKENNVSTGAVDSYVDHENAVSYPSKQKLRKNAENTSKEKLSGVYDKKVDSGPIAIISR